jgi:hypothetical protein
MAPEMSPTYGGIRCETCCKIHHELPDFLILYKRYGGGKFEQVVSTQGPIDVAADESTLYRWRKWFVVSTTRKDLEQDFWIQVNVKWSLKQKRPWNWSLPISKEEVFMRTKTLDLENVRRLEEAVKDGVYARPSKPSKKRDEITKRKIQALKNRKAKRWFILLKKIFTLLASLLGIAVIGAGVYASMLITYTIQWKERLMIFTNQSARPTRKKIKNRSIKTRRAAIRSNKGWKRAGMGCREKFGRDVYGFVAVAV